MRIHIEDLRFSCIIGILDFEREKEQDIIIHLTIDYTFTQEFINYAEVVDFLKFQMKNEKFLLLEDALSSLSNNLKENFSLIENLFIKITKPSIIPDAMVSVSDFYTFES